MPQPSQQNRRTAIEHELDQVPPDSESIRLPWKESHEVCPVIKLALDAIVLNPRSHRLQAQLASHPDREYVREDPHGVKAQDLLAELLREDEGFNDLKANLEEEGQRNPGVTTRTGLLVNGNRRAVALKDIERQYMRVAVLPANATEKQIAELELKLQVTREFRQDYTFTNLLLFVEELRMRYGYSASQIALMLRFAQSSDPSHLKKGIAEVERETRMLAMIREIQSLSDNHLPYVHFDDQRTALQEIDKTYEKLKLSSPLEAERLRTTKFIGVVLGAGYNVVRQMDAHFFDTYFQPELEENDELNNLFPINEVLETFETPQEDGDPDLDLLSPDGGPSGEDHDGVPGGFLAWISSLDDHVFRAGTKDIRLSVGRQHILDSVKDSLERAAEQRKLDAKEESRVDAPSNRIREATTKVVRARTLLSEFLKPKELDTNKLQFRVKKLERAVRELRSTFDAFRGQS